jgi:ATP-dependent DNA helicase RecG
MNPNFLQTPIAYLKGVGPNRAETLKSELGLETFRDLLHLFPNRYLDRTSYYKVNQLQPSGADVQVVGKIIHIKTVEQKRGKRLVATFVDETGQMELVWFRGHKWIKESLQINEPYVVFGRVSKYGSMFSMPHPDMELLSKHQQGLKIAMQPIYPSTEKLVNKGITNRVVSQMLQQLLLESGGQFAESLPQSILEELRLISKSDALLNIHFPKNQELLAKAQFRLKFEELFFVQMQLISKKMLRKQKIKGLPFENVGEKFTDFFANHLPFELTEAQKRVIKEIRNDLGSNAQMNRLLQGDVGSGKTIVALMCMLLAIDNGFQACLMAPTEILATQHYNGLKELLVHMDVKIALLTGSTKKSERTLLHNQLENGNLNILVGTHAVLEDKVQFKNLGLAIVDEQHRFGVAQRSKLWQKGSPPLLPPKGRVDEIRYKYQTAKLSAYKILKKFQQERKKNTTEAERILWEYLKTKKLGVKFRRQHVVDEFIVDFICISKKLIIEVDGGYHNNPLQKEADAMRTAILNDFGYKVVRFKNEEVVGTIDSVIERIEKELLNLPLGEDGGAIPPHILVMTATPIPRTLAMSLYGDLDVSVIDELPPGRKPVKTVHRFDSNRLKVFRFIKDEIKKGRQIYIVYPLIQESEAMDYKDLMDGYESIVRDFPQPEYQISIVHGKMKPADKDYEMERFLKGETQIMVATTVIEVGVNVPNASVMIIESAERFGLSQLHQLRGRVGRGAEQSYCILMTGHKLSDDAKTRLQTMTGTNDGFEIAEVDLKLRGPGDLMGTQQSGMLNLKIADIVKDNQILKTARYHAIQLLKNDPRLEKPENKPVLHAYSKMMANKTIWNYIS